MTIESIGHGVTYKVKLSDDEHFFLIINSCIDGDVYEIFARVDDKEHFEIVNLITRLTSMGLRAGVKPLTIAKELQTVYSMTTQHIIPGTNTLCPSLVARIGIILEEYINELQNDKE